MSIETVLQIIAKIMIIFLVLPIHEFAHAWAAHKLGDDTAAYAGRLTINPLAHIDIVGAICLLVSPFGWAKPVPINPLKFKKQRLGIAVTAAAGPISNLIVSFIAVVILRLITSIPGIVELGYSSINAFHTFSAIVTILNFFINVNIGLAVFNLIPIPPLDGSKILMYFTSAKFDKWFREHQMIINMAFLMVVITHVLNRPIELISGYILKFFVLITDFIPKLTGA